VFQGRFAQGAFEIKHLVGQSQRIAVLEIDFHLAGADLVDQGVDVEVHQVAVIVDVLEQRIELVDGVDAVHLAAGFGAPAAADRGGQRQVGVDVFRRQIKLEFWRDQRLPALLGVQFQHAAQHRARGEIDQFAIGKVTVVDHLRGRVDRPRHHGDGGGVGLQDHVAVGAGNGAVVGVVVGRRIAGDSHAEHGFRQAHAALFGEFDARQDLAAGNAGQVGDQAFDFSDALGIEPLVHVGVAEILADCHDCLCVLDSCSSSQDATMRPARMGERTRQLWNGAGRSVANCQSRMGGHVFPSFLAR
jgi:hypothetical protein